MKHLIISSFLFLFAYSCKANSIDDIKTEFTKAVQEYIAYIQEKPFIKSQDGLKVIYVVVIVEKDSTISVSINHDWRIISLPYISPNFTFNFDQKTIFVRASNLSNELIQSLNLVRYDTIKKYYEIEALEQNHNKMVCGVEESIFMEIKNGQVLLKKLIQSEEVEGDLWIYGSEYTKEIQVKD